MGRDPPPSILKNLFSDALARNQPDQASGGGTGRRSGEVDRTVYQTNAGVPYVRAYLLDTVDCFNRMNC